MGSRSSRSVEIQISNNTWTITLKNPRTYFVRGHCSKPPLPELFPRCSDTCSFSGDPKRWGVAGTTSVLGILVYEAESFTLAVYFYNDSDYNKSSIELGLELSPGKAHLDNLKTTYARMAEGTYSNSCQDIKFARAVVDKNHGTAQLSHGPIRVMAAMSCGMSSTLKVVLEEQRESRKEAKRKKHWDVKGDRPRRIKILLDLPEDFVDSPGRV